MLMGEYDYILNFATLPTENDPNVSESSTWYTPGVLYKWRHADINLIIFFVTLFSANTYAILSQNNWPPPLEHDIFYEQTLIGIITV